MSWILNIVYLAVLVIASPHLLYTAIRKGKYRQGFAEKFLGCAPARNWEQPCIWLHAVSVGEVNLLATLLNEFERRRPDVECVISTTTMTGFALAKKKYAPRTVFYCPLDFSWAVQTAMRRIRPDLLLLAELELWPNLIRAAKAHCAKVAVVNGRLSEKSFRGYARIRPLVRSVLSQIDVIGAQNEEYGSRFRALGGENVHVTGSLKFDGAQTDRNNTKTRELAALAGIREADVVFLAGSTQSPEEETALAAFRELQDEHPNLRLILVPRHPDRFDEVAELLEQSGMPWQRRSQLYADHRVPLPDCSAVPKRNMATTAGQASSATACNPRILFGRHHRRTGRLVGGGAHRLRRRQHGEPRRAKYDRTSRLRRGRRVRTQNLQFPRRGPANAGCRRGGCRSRW